MYVWWLKTLRDMRCRLACLTWPYLSLLSAAGYYCPFHYWCFQSVHQFGPKNLISLCLWKAWRAVIICTCVLWWARQGWARLAVAWTKRPCSVRSRLVRVRVCVCVRVHVCVLINKYTCVCDWWLLFVSQPRALLARAQAWLTWMYKYTRLPSVCATSRTPLFHTTLWLQR